MKGNSGMTSKSVNLKTRGVIALALSITLAMPMVTPVSAFAATLFTYNGQGICDKYSINQGTISSDRTCTVTHTQKRNYGGNSAMQVSMRRQEGLFWSTKASRSFSNDVTGQKFSSWLPAGTYKLYFKTVSGGNTFNISGSFAG